MRNTLLFTLLMSLLISLVFDVQSKTSADTVQQHNNMVEVMGCVG
jgi:hypothetical protein